MPIKILSEETINKIAAGEVIERPANAVKELAENALDAGSRRIEIELRGAGRQLIRVRDDGTGMAREDLTLAVTRHATSKINEFSDIYGLSTMGFRGEALPSIAAVSRFTLQSQPHSAPSGWEIRIAGGKLKESRAWAGAPGTTVEVSDLFFNTPARAKFLKVEATERNHCLRIIEELALARPDVAFTVIAEGKTVLAAPEAKTARERVMDVLGTAFANKLIPIEASHPLLSLTGFVTRREHSFPGRQNQFLFINRRPVNLGKLITHSLYEAYRETLPQGRHPGVVLFLEINPAEVDVNIHPTKREVKFSRESELHDFIYRAIKEAVVREMLGPSLPGPGREATPPPSSAKKSLPPAAKPVSLPFGHTRNYIPERSSSSEAYVAEVLKAYKTGDASGETETGTFKVLGQAFSLYVVLQYRNELLIIDQHAAAERVRYERYLTEWQGRKVMVQSLLLPITVELPPSQAGLIKENIAVLKETGWDIAEFGANTFRITGLPAVLGNDIEAQRVMGEIIHALAEEVRLPAAQKPEKIIRAACRASIKAGDRIAPPEIERLAKDLFTCLTPGTCPHGRPTFYRLSLEDLQRFFGRK
jgi:DNA mismatch repair protein MutL